jgi:hypothetical protein
LYGIALIIIAVIAATTAGLFHLAGHPVSLRDVIVVAAAIAVAVECSLLAIRLLTGADQASAVQAGMTGMVLVMFLSVAVLGACLLMGVVGSDAAVRCSPLLFIAALVLVAFDAIRTIRSVPAGAGTPKTGADKVK